MIVYQKCTEAVADGSSVLLGGRLSCDASDQYVVDAYIRLEVAWADIGPPFTTGCSAVVAHLPWEQVVAGSSPAIRIYSCNLSL